MSEQEQTASENDEQDERDEANTDETGSRDEEPDKSVDEEWKEQARKEKEKLREKAKKKQQQGEGPQEAMPEASFSTIVGGMGVQTAMALGQVENPATGQTEVDLQQARHLIDSLKVLQEKTEGNLTRQEKQHLESLLKELQMQFVQVAKQQEDDGDTPSGETDSTSDSGAGASGGGTGEGGNIYTP